MPVDPGIRTTHLCQRISECVLVTGTRSAESIMASGYGTPHQQAGHMAAPTSPASPSKKTLAKAEPSTHGTSQPNRPQPPTSVAGGKSDILIVASYGRV
jgi:hypothetical protein